jgi:hypothetical protein
MLPQQNNNSALCQRNWVYNVDYVRGTNQKSKRARDVKNSNNQQTFLLDLLPGKIRDTKIIMISVYVFDIPGRPQRYSSGPNYSSHNDLER